jgi:hypothetical protein
MKNYFWFFLTFEVAEILGNAFKRCEAKNIKQLTIDARFLEDSGMSKMGKKRHFRSDL